MQLLQDCLTNITAYVRTSSLKSDKFKMNGGVPQGSSLSPGLFVSTLGFAIEDAFKNLETIHGEFADDLFNIVYDKDKIIPVILNNMNSLSKIGSKLEPSKTELFHVSARGEDEVYGITDSNLSFTSDSTFDEMFKLQPQKSMRYLGDQLGSARKAIKVRISKANQRYGMLYHRLFSKPDISYQVKIRVFKACVLPILMYGLKCHAATITIMRPLNNFCLRKLKSIFGLQFDARISYERMEEMLEELDIEWEWPMHRLQTQRLQFFIDKLEDEEIVEILTPKKGEKRRRGKPRYRMIDAIKEDLKWDGRIEFKKITQDLSRTKKIMWICKLLGIEKPFIDPG